MRNRMLSFVILVFALALAGVPAWAQGGGSENQPLYTFVALWGVPRAQWGEVDKAREAIKPVLDKLIADGTLVSYGGFAVVAHDLDGPTHGNFFQAHSRAGILKALEAITAQPANIAPVFAAAKHTDYFQQSTIHGARSGTFTNAYLRVISVQAKRGRMDDFLSLLRSQLKPIYDKLLADGTILSYAIDTQYVTLRDPDLVFSVGVAANAEAVDKVAATFGDFFNKHPDVLKGLQELSEPGSFRSFLSRITSMTHK